MQGGATFDTVSRESALLLNNVFLVASCAAVFVGTLYPLVLDALTGEKISVGPPYYALTFAPIFFALLLLVPFGPQTGLAARRSEGQLAHRLAPALGLAAHRGAGGSGHRQSAHLDRHAGLRRRGLADRRQRSGFRQAQRRARQRLRRRAGPCRALASP